MLPCAAKEMLMDERQLPNAAVSLWPRWFFPGTRSVIERKRKIRRYDPVDFPEEPPENAAEIALLARLRALQESVIRFSAWDRREVGELIKGARDAVVVAHDPKVGAELLSRAQETYYLGLQTRNRLSYALWSVVGTMGTFFLFMALRWGLGLSKLAPDGAQVHLPDWDTTFKVVGLATLGSLVSAATRVISIDLRLERNKSILFAMAVAKALVAVGFAIVVYIVLAGGLAKFGGLDSSRHDVWFVAAFLSGFSERFASDLLAKIPGSQDPGKR
jgi:hypothetical protein